MVSLPRENPLSFYQISPSLSRICLYLLNEMCSIRHILCGFYPIHTSPGYCSARPSIYSYWCRGITAGADPRPAGIIRRIDFTHRPAYDPPTERGCLVSIIAAPRAGRAWLRKWRWRRVTRIAEDLGGSEWRFGCVRPKLLDAQLDDRAEVEELLPATVPGNVRTDLLAAGRIEDPFYGTNNEQSQWVDAHD
jgi:hypothetical protein